MIGVLPNPATDNVVFTYPAGTEAGVLEIHDTQGRLVNTVALLGRKGLVDGNVSKLEAGMYTVRLMLDGHRIGMAKFTVL